MKKISKPIEDDDIKEKNEKKGKAEEEDWYKEMEELIDLESTKKIEKALRGSKTSNLNKKKKNSNKSIISEFEIETEGIENKYLTNHNSKATLKKLHQKNSYLNFLPMLQKKKKK